MNARHPPPPCFASLTLDDVDEDDWSSQEDYDRIHALAVEAVALLRSRASILSQPALVLLAAELVTTLFADLVPRDEIEDSINCVMVSLCANVEDPAVEVWFKGVLPQ